MLAVNAASMKFFRGVSCVSLFKKNFSVSRFTDVLQKDFFMTGRKPGIVFNQQKEQAV